jgi:tripartite-type tricarboxylate transporter receptor subunit TctC
MVVPRGAALTLLDCFFDGCVMIRGRQAAACKNPVRGFERNGENDDPAPGRANDVVRRDLEGNADMVVKVSHWRKTRGSVGLATLLATLLLAACGTRTGAPAAERGQSLADFYSGKTITIVVGYAPGGGFDTTARLAAKHLGKHIPGNPNVIVENMPGAGSLTAANHVYNVARPDGLTIGVFHEAQVLNQAAGVEGVAFDARQMGWLGNAVQAPVTCTIRADSPYNTAEDLMRRDLPPLVLGGTAPGAETDNFPRLLNAITGANTRLVSGYGGTSEIRLAVESREVDGLCWSYTSVTSTAAAWLDSNFIKVPLYQWPQADPKVQQRFPNAKRLEEIVTDEQSRSLIRAVTAPAAISKPFAVPPRLPADRLKALQEAFDATMKDPEFLAESEQAKLDVIPNNAAETTRIVNEILALPPEMTSRVAEIIK